MYLKELNLKGFKSFARKTALKFEPGLTIIVGPNGSGKSNIADAVMWVLGEQSPSSLRGSRMEDVIFAGSGVHKPVNCAEVELVLDNSNNNFPFSYLEISISRVVARGGESEYLLNNTPCRLTDIQEILSDAGIGRTLNSVVSQGQLEEVLSMRPEERRRYIEEAGGLLKFRRRREKSNRKLERTEDEILRVKDVLREVKRQIKPLSHQAKRFEAYKELNHQLQQAKLTLLVSRLKEVMRQREELGACLSQKRSRLDSLKEQIEGITRGIASIERDSTDWRLRESSLRDALYRLIAVHERLIAYSEKIIVPDEEEPYLLPGELEKLEGELESLEEKISSLGEENIRTNQELESALEAEEEMRKQLFECEQRLGAIARDAAICEGKIEGLKRAISQRMSGSLNPQDACYEDMDSLCLRERNLSAEYEQLEASACRIQAEIDKTTDELDSLQIKKNELLGKIRETDAKASSLLARLEILAHLNDLRWDFASAASELEKSDPTGGGLSEMLAYYLEIEEGYEAAISGFLGPWLFGMLGKDDDALKRAIEYLKEEGMGKALFFRTQRNASGKIGDIEQPCPEGLRRARDLVKAPEIFSDALDVLLGDVYMVRDLDEGLRCAEDYPNLVFLTPDADVISGGGLVKGGSNEFSEAFKEISRKRMEEQEELASRYLEKLDLLELELEALSTREADLLTEIRNLYLELGENNMEKATVSSNLAVVRERISLARGEKPEAGEGLDLQEERIEELEKALKIALQEKEREEKRAAELQKALEETRAQIRGLEKRIRQIDAETKSLSDRKAEILTKLGARDREKESAIRPLARKVSYLCDRLVNHAASKRRELETAIKNREKTAEDEYRTAADLKRSLELLSREEESLKELLHQDEVADAELKFKINQLSSEIIEGHRISVDVALRQYESDEPVSSLERRIETLASELERLGPVNPVAVNDLEALEERGRFLSEQLEDLVKSKSQLKKIIREIDSEIERKFAETFTLVDEHFRRIFSFLFPGGKAELRLTDPDDPLNTGVEIYAQPEGKKLRRISLLSGGETALTAIAFFFALFEVRPSPFYFLDEVEAALDDVNLNRFLRLVGEFKNKSQLILITHQKRSMEIADVLYGISMQGDGVSRVISQRMDRHGRESDVISPLRATSSAIA